MAIELFEPLKEALYDDRFFLGEADSLASARAIATIVYELLQPGSVVDVGCGWGSWLLAFHECGVERLLGVDGDHVNTDRLLIDPACFNRQNLAATFAIHGSFDLAICLEVAEHLPRRNARHLVRTLTTIAPAVLFSAAVPSQGGSNHINEQWPSYWRGLFKAENFRMFDCVRPRIRERQDIQWWYRQNLVIYVRTDAISSYLQLGPESQLGNEIEWVHVSLVRPDRNVRTIVRKLPGFLWLWTRLKQFLRQQTRSPREYMPSPSNRY
jgi:Methyltransferase domain